MSNIDRRYAYLDEGVFPAEGEYGVTYLTLYSSNAGNVYDGWVYDPDDKIEESSTPRTYGYRNPDYQQYCWDDEVVVDLSNAQNRQESSESVQGRITSFNTNVSSSPIILQDIDITGLTEEERENKATVVLFSAIPIVKDAYIQAQIEVQCKCNLSPDNTSGEMRIEAFYILNDESDRTMRPNPVHTFTVSSPNERHTLPWIYWNPALKHEDHNYIGVKLIATGGTAEIGISDDPDYGDAIITLASGGLNGDIVYNGHPVSLEIFGKEEVVGGYKLNPDDYTVLCTYDTGEIYEVTRMCTFNPEMGTAITESTTLLTANYLGLRAAMYIYLGLVESIELFGLEDIYDSYKLKLTDYTVLAYLDNGDVMEVTGECTFSPSMGTVISTNTTLVATYEPYWMIGASFTDSLNIVSHGDAIISESPNDGLIYKLYSDHHITITGNSHLVGEDYEKWEYIAIPNAIRSMMSSSSEYSIEWAAEGCISGYVVPSVNISFLKGFKDVKVRPERIRGNSGRAIIRLNVNGSSISSDDLMFFNNIDYKVPDSPNYLATVNDNNFDSTFRNCDGITHLNFLSKLELNRMEDPSYRPSFMQTFYKCENLSDISGIANLDMSYVKRVDNMLYGCKSLTSLSDTAKWKLYYVWTAYRMCYDSGLESLEGCGDWEMGKLFKLENPDSPYPSISECFSHTKITDVEGVEGWFKQGSAIESIGGFIHENQYLTSLKGSEEWDMRHINSIRYLCSACPNLTDITQSSSWHLSDNCDATNAFSGSTNIENISIVNTWLSSCSSVSGMFSAGTSGFNYGNAINILKPSDDLSVIFGELIDGKIQTFTYSNGGRTKYGMFSGRDPWSWVKSGGTIIGIRFIYPGALPQWYMNAISVNLGYPIIND